MSAAIDLREVLSDRYAVQDELACRSLRHFTKRAFAVLEPDRPYVANWHIDAISEHLEALQKREIRNLLINIPPRSMKSLTASVCFPAWVWLHDPIQCYLTTSYNAELSTRDAVKTRQILSSEWYKRLQWHCNPEGKQPFYLLPDQNQKTRYKNNKGGYRISSSPGGTATGEGGDTITCDDPHNVLEGESEKVRGETIRWWRESMSTRFNDPQTVVRLVTMQRVNGKDVSKDVMELGYEHLNLPLTYQGKCVVELGHKCTQKVGKEGKEKYNPTSIGYTDPRKKIGELLWPKRMTQKIVDTLRKVMGDFAYFCQMEQQPGSRAGGMFKPARIQIVEKIPSPLKIVWRAWDKAGTEGGDGAFTATIKMGLMENGGFIYLDGQRDRLAAEERENWIRDLALQDGKGVSVSIEQEPGSGGKESAERSQDTTLRGFESELDKVTGSKEARAESLAVEVGQRNVFMLKAAWNEEVLDELRFFPNSEFKDYTDAGSQAFTRLHTAKPIQVFL